MTDKKKKRVGVLAILLLFLLLGGGFFIYIQERPELYIPKDEIITRGDFAAILVRDITLDTVDSKKDTASFPDIRGHWSEKYIEALIDAGIIDPADYPMHKIKPGKLKIAIIFSIFSIALTFLVFWIIRLIKN